MTNTKDIFGSIHAGRVLDVATGSGYFLKLLTDEASDYSEGIGVDTKEAAAGPFGETFENVPNIVFQAMKAEELEFEDASFDTVCISNSLHHLVDPLPALNEMKRVLKPGGRFIISEMYQDGEQTETQKTHILIHHWMAAIDSVNNIIHHETYKRQQLIDFGTELGLEKINMVDLVDLSYDPKDPEIVADYDPIILRSIERAEGHPDWQKQGEELRQRLLTIGYHSASALLLVGEKV